jgi:peptide deformylase
VKILPRKEFGDPILREKARQLTKSEISSVKIQGLIKNMHHTLVTKKFGIGLAAPQIGEGIALSVIAIRPTKHRPDVDNFDCVIINPKITKTFGAKRHMWEGCLSAGESGLFAKVKRYHEVEVSYVDEKGEPQKGKFVGLQAQVMQHEIDHLNGVLFMDHVTDPASYMTLKEYKKRIVSKRHKIT